nr:hypothetical protein [uncultured Campylobacter sp.]
MPKIKEAQLDLNNRDYALEVLSYYTFGEVLNLRQAMVKDRVLQIIVEKYIASDKAKQNEMINDIIYRWANSDQIDPNIKFANLNLLVA